MSFVDRKVAEGMFRELLGERPIYRTLNIYGKHGMGKSRFSRYIKEKYLEKAKYIVYAEMNFEDRLLHKQHKAIMHLAKLLEEEYDFNFISLWKAYAMLWYGRYEHSPIMYAADLPYFHEVKKLLKIDKNGKIDVDITKGLVGEEVAKDLEELKNLDSAEIEARLPRFFANDLRELIKNSDYKDCVIILENIDLIKENSDATPCSKDAWIRELITKVGKDALFIITSQEKLNWQGCNSAWRDVIKAYFLTPFSPKDALRYLTMSDLKNENLKQAICASCEREPFWLSLAKDSYSDNISYTLPTNRSEILDAFIKRVDETSVKLLKVLSHARFFTLDLIKVIGIQFGLSIDKALIKRLMNYDFIKEISEDKYAVDTLLKENLIAIENDLEGIEYNAFMFSYWENTLQSLDQSLIKSTPQIIDEAIEEAWYHLNIINKEPLVHFEWLDYYVSRFFMYAAWEPFIDRYHQIMPKLQKANDSVSLDRLISLYNNLAGLYESLGESKKSRAYYNKVIELNRPQLLSA